MNTHHCILTPADHRHNDKVAFCDSDKDNNQFLEHEHSLRSHPHHSGQSEVVDEQGDSNAALTGRSLSDTHKKYNEHAEHGDAELDMELGGISLAKSPAESEWFWQGR